jgi:hypothetical protein
MKGVTRMRMMMVMEIMRRMTNQLRRMTSRMTRMRSRMTRMRSRMTRMKDGVLLIRSEAFFSRQMPNMIPLIFMKTGTGTTAIAEVIFLPIYIFVI